MQRARDPFEKDAFAAGRAGDDAHRPVAVRAPRAHRVPGKAAPALREERGAPAEQALLGKGLGVALGGVEGHFDDALDVPVGRGEAAYVDPEPARKRRADLLAVERFALDVARLHHLLTHGRVVRPFPGAGTAGVVAVGALAAAERERETIRAGMTSTIDRTDVAGAMLRAELRTWLRGLSDAQRNKLMLQGEMAQADMDPRIALAVVEDPSALSGVTPAQHQRLADRALAALHPEGAARLAEIDVAAEAVSDAYGAARLTIESATGCGPGTIDEAAGAPSLGERLRARLAADGITEPGEAA